MSESEEEKEKKKKTAMQIWKQDYEAMLTHKPVSLTSKREDRFVMLPPPQVDPSIMKEAREIIKDKGGLIYTPPNSDTCVDKNSF